MKNPLIALACLLLLFSCARKQEEKNSTSSTPLTEAYIKSKWEQVFFKEGKWILESFCDGNNFNLKWKGDTILYDIGQEVLEEVITGITSEQNKFFLEGPARYKGITPPRFQVAPHDSIPGFAWWWIMGAEEPILMVHESMREKIPIVSSPCDEDDPGQEEVEK